MLKQVKVKCIFLGYRKGIVGNKLWRLDDVTSKVVLYRNMGFNESGKYKETLIGPGVFGLHKVQTLDLIDYHSTDDREKLSEQELFRYKKDSIDVAFVVAEVEKIYAHGKAAMTTTMAITESIHQYGDLQESEWEYSEGVTVQGLQWEVVGSQEYQLVYTRPDIVSADVGIS
ncbi:hypothetical protein Tco_1165126 [Tanacetum coccineum]